MKLIRRLLDTGFGCGSGAGRSSSSGMYFLLFGIMTCILNDSAYVTGLPGSRGRGNGGRGNHGNGGRSTGGRGAGRRGSTERTTEDRPPPILRVATIQMAPFVHIRWEPGLIANDRYVGLYIDLLKELAAELGVRYQLYLVPDGKTGHTGEDGSWNGLIGELERGDADLVLAPIVTITPREEAVSFTRPLLPLTLSVLSLNSPSSNDGRPYGVVVNSEAFHALKSDPSLYTSLKVNYGLIYVSSMMEALDRVREGHFNLLLPSQLAQYQADQEPCDLSAREFHTFPGLSLALATQQGADVLHPLNAALEKLLGPESRLLERLEGKWLVGGCSRAGTVPTSLQTTMHHTVDALSRNRQLVIASSVMEPYLMRSPKRGVEFEGYLADLIRQLAQVVPFEYQWRIQRKLGRLRKDGSWTGMMGDILNQRADLAAAPFIITEETEDLLSFSKPFLESSLSLVMQETTADAHPSALMVEDLLNQTAVDFGVVHKSQMAQQLRRSSLPLYKQLWSKLKSRDRENRVNTIGEGLERVRQGPFALIMESTDATFITSRRPCDLISLSQYLVVANYAFATIKGSLLVGEINNALLRLQEDGVLQALFHKWWNTDECLEEQEARYEQPEPEDHQPTSTTTSSTTTKPNRPLLDFDLDAALGLATDSYDLPENETYEEDGNENLDAMDQERIFFTSPLQPFTPQRQNPLESPSTISASVGDVTVRPRVPRLPAITSSITSSITSYTTASEATRAELTTSLQTTTAATPTPTTITTTSIETATNTVSTTVPSTTRRRGKKKRPGRKKGRKRKKSTIVPATNSTVHVSPSSSTHAPTKPRDFNRNIDWFFVTEQPRPEDYDYYDNYTSYTRGADATPNSTFHPPQTPRVVSRTTTMDTDHPPAGSQAPPPTMVSRAVLFVVIMHLVVFGWPDSAHDCKDSCSR